jgi:hypothetical protein
MKSSNFPLIIFILIALLCIGFQRIDCQRNKKPRPYENAYPVSYPVNVPKNIVPIRVTPNGNKTSNQKKTSGSALVGNKFRPELKLTQRRMKLKNV